MRVIIGADLVPSTQNYDLFEKGNAEDLVGKDLASILRKADIRVFNLETVVGSKGLMIKKSGPYLRCPEQCIRGIKALNPTVLSIANNHVMDFGKDGLLETIRIIEDNDIEWVGAGENSDSLKKSLIIEKSGLKVGIYSCAEHEFSIAGVHYAGCNPYDPLYSFDDVRELSYKCDYVIVLYHGNKEYYRYPSPEVQRMCRKFAECGAGIVLCQHSHCIGATEEYKDSELVYGQGNFLFYGGETDEYFQTGSLVEVEIDENTKKCLITYIPIVKNGVTIRLASESEKREILKEFMDRSRQIEVPGFVEENYRRFASSMIDTYYSRCLGKVRKNIIFKCVNKLLRGRILRSCFSEKECIEILNTIQCEAHRELFLEGLKGKIYGKTDKT